MPVTLTRLDVDATASTTARKGLGIVANKSGIVTANNVAGQQINWFPWDGSSFGTRTSDDDGATAVMNAISVNNAGTVVAVADLLGGAVRAWSIAPGPTLGALLSTSAAMAGGNCAGMAWAPDDSFLAVAWTNSPYVQAMSWDGSSFGPVISATAPSVAPTSSTAGRAIAWAPDGSAVACALGTGGDIAVYPWTGSAFGTKSEPAGAKTFTTGSGAQGCDFSPDGTQIALAGDNSPFLCMYAWNGTTVGATRIAVPTIIGGAGGIGSVVLFDLGGEYVFLGGTSMDESRNLYVYPWDGAAFGTKVDANVQPGPIQGMGLTDDNTTIFTWDNVADAIAFATSLTASTATASGTLPPTVPEGTLRGGGGTAVVVLDGETFVAVLTPAIVQDIIDGMVGSGSGPDEWNNTDLSGVTVDRVSDTEIVITVPPLPGYDTDTGETVTITLPGSALTGGSELVVTPDPAFSITAGPEPAAGGPQPWQSAEREALRVLATAQGTEVRHGVQAVERTLQELLAEITGLPAAGPFPTDREKLYDAIFDALNSMRVRNVKETYILDAIERFLP